MTLCPTLILSSSPFNEQNETFRDMIRGDRRERISRRDAETQSEKVNKAHLVTFTLPLFSAPLRLCVSYSALSSPLCANIRMKKKDLPRCAFHRR